MLQINKNILIVEDNHINISVLTELLSDSYETFVAIDAKVGFEILRDEKIDLILLDVMLPGIDGYEFCSIIKKDKLTKDIPVIFITSNKDENSIEKAFESGGIDYINKPFNHRELMARIKTQLKVANLISELEFAASFDALTGVYNRRRFFKEAISNFEHSKENLYAVMIDIDKFKTINDTYGHSTGDKVIKAITSIISKNIPDSCIFGRIGGDEFSVIAYSNTPNIIMDKSNQIRELIKEVEISNDDGTAINFTISSGIARAGVSTANIDELLKEADLALYDAKGAGRDKAIFR